MHKFGVLSNVLMQREERSDLLRHLGISFLTSLNHQLFKNITYVYWTFLALCQSCIRVFVFVYLTVGNISFDVLGPWAFQKHCIIAYSVVVLWFVWCASDVQSDFLGFPPLPSCLVNHADISWFWQIWHIYEAGYLSAQQEQKSVYSISSIQSEVCTLLQFHCHEIRLSGYSKSALFCRWWTSGDISWVS